MLVLSRKSNQQIVIDQNIFVTVLEVRGSRVRVGIDAPKDVSIHRQELPRSPKRRATLERPKGGPPGS